MDGIWCAGPSPPGGARDGGYGILAEKMKRRERQMPGMSHLLNHLPARSHRARWAAVLLVAGCLLAAFALRDHGAPYRFPPISISTIDGRNFDSAAIEGRPLLVTFWSTTCLVCLREMPELEALYRRLSRRGFEVIAVAMPWDPPDEVVRLARARPIPYPVALDVNGAIARAFGDVSATPTHFLIGPSGDVAFHRTGALDFAELEDRLQSML